MNGMMGNEVGGPGLGWRHESVGGRGAIDRKSVV